MHRHCTTQQVVVSIHASREGRDANIRKFEQEQKEFQSTRPVKDATQGKGICLWPNSFQSTRPVKDAT